MTDHTGSSLVAASFRTFYERELVMSDLVEYGEAVERHVMAFSDVDVEVNVDGEGNAWVNFNQGGETMTSFTIENFAEVAAFVARNANGVGA